ncbi:C2H2 type zinc-finger (2 copies) [Popillia japonica]|uniref:C2H2 type zinc-finger (2 copies) n=1 Tax=Popillia japonica TaxID=7064 RepID=A0AAW1JWN7_POPJA
MYYLFVSGEGGEEGGEEGGIEDGDKLEGDEESGTMTPNSAVSLAPGDEDVNSPPAGDLASPRSPRSYNEDPTFSNHLTDREIISPRCQSRDSSEYNPPPRCPSGESMFSERGLPRGVPLSATGLSPVGVALPPTLPPAAAAALLPPQSAMAAYLNAAAVAAQHTQLMMASPLPRGSVSPLVSSSSSPPGILLSQSRSSSSPLDVPLQSPIADAAILDFSKRASKNETMEPEGDAINLAKPDTPPSGETPNGPLDLSFSTRKRIADDITLQPPSRKSRSNDYKSVLPQWPASHLPYFAAAVAAASSLSPKTNSSVDLWNGKLKHGDPTPNDATKALEKMSQLSKLGGDDLFRTMANPSASVNSASSRHSAWQSHWLNKGADQAKDVLKCVWCKQSFPSLAAMTTHMKEAKHCGVNVPVPPMQPQSIPTHPPPTTTNTNSNSSPSSSSCKPNQADLNLLIKETMPLPRKLVRGQDVWLGKGAEQTRQILKCMWCGQSFRSLAEMTSHMQQTQHYTNIISQEQIISWRSNDDGKGPTGGNNNGSSGPPGSASSHVSAVLTCKVCDQAFSSLKELSNHMVKNSHYKEHIMRSITESGGRRRQTREKRKKSLPVRKLLELERAQHEFKNGDNGAIIEKTRDAAGAGRITCEKCGNKIETSLFVDHIRQCVGGLGANQRNFLKSALMSNNIIPPETHREKTKNEKSPSPSSQSQTQQQRPPSVAADLSSSSKETTPVSESNNGSSPSVLNAIEKLIEKSFDSRGRQSNAFPGYGHTAAPIGSSILKRLGIDESVDYTKPLVDPQTMNLLRTYHQQSQHHYGRRERSGSESSSISERGSSRVDALTPERKMEPPGIPVSSTPRSTPDKRDKSPISEKSENIPADEVSIKKEIDDDDRHSMRDTSQEISIKREIEEGDEDDRNSYHSNGHVKEGRDEDDDLKRTSSPLSSPRRQTPSVTEAGQASPCRNSTCSPASSDRSGTPRSTNGDRKTGGGSLGALSSMFDSLQGGGSMAEPASNTGKRGSSHPLAALQKLCDKTETHHTNNRSSTAAAAATINVASTTTPNSGTTPGAILAFSWACNDAVVTSDSIMKCAFCDTPFISKGAYRHHLSKMHFVKDGVIPDPVTLKAAQPSIPSTSSASKVTAGPLSSTSGAGSTESKSPSPATSGFDESTQSKFLKYTELAKQLSSKYV